MNDKNGLIWFLNIALVFNILFFSFQCSPDLDSLAQKGKKKVREKCMYCHGLNTQNIGPPLESLYKKFGEKKLNAYLNREFGKNDEKILQHQNIYLTKEEIKQISVYLKVLGGELLPY